MPKTPRESLITDQFLNALMMAESGGDPNALGDRNLTNTARGAFQLRLPAVKDVLRLNPDFFSGTPDQLLQAVTNNPVMNRNVAELYLQALEGPYGLNTLENLIAGFNFGPTATRRALREGTPFPDVTLREIERVKQFMGLSQ